MKTILALIVTMLFAACSKTPPANNAVGAGLPDVQLATSLPQFAREVNEVQIADSFNDVDPTWVIGALVNVKTGKVYALDSYLKPSAKPKVSPQTEVVFRNFVENSVAAQAQWLEFVKAQVNDTTRAEVSVTKTAKVSVESESVDKAKLLEQLNRNKISPKEDFGVIIGFTNYVLAASYFKHSGAEGSVAGYGAKIGGNWYSKFENSSANHRIVAVWSPLPFVLANTGANAKGNLEKLTIDAIKSNSIKSDALAIPQKSNLRLLPA